MERRRYIALTKVVKAEYCLGLQENGKELNPLKGKVSPFEAGSKSSNKKRLVGLWG